MPKKTYHIELRGRNRKTHGLSTSRDYNRWNTMIQRCTNPNVNNFHNYGGRGIKVCERWMKFENFFQDMGRKPKGLSLERVDNNGNYEPSNCVWGTRKVQSRNTRKNRIYTVNGVTACLTDLCELFHKNYHTVYDRLHKGWSVERAFYERNLRPRN